MWKAKGVGRVQCTCSRPCSITVSRSRRAIMHSLLLEIESLGSYKSWRPKMNEIQYLHAQSPIEYAFTRK